MHSDVQTFYPVTLSNPFLVLHRYQSFINYVCILVWRGLLSIILFNGVVKMLNKQLKPTFTALLVLCFSLRSHKTNNSVPAA